MKKLGIALFVCFAAAGPARAGGYILQSTFTVGAATIGAVDRDLVGNLYVFGLPAGATTYKVTAYQTQGITPLFAFGHGLSYTSFGVSDVAAVARDGAVTVTFAVKNTGRRDGKAVAQVYVAPAAGGWEAPKRLAGWDKLALKAGQKRSATVRIDPRLLGVYDSATHGWKIAAGDYVVTLADSASAAPQARVTLHLDARTLDVRGK